MYLKDYRSIQADIENVSKSVESVNSIPVFGDVIAKILLMLVSILTIFFIIKIIDVLLP
jgi:hypothetical protein